MGMMFKYLTQLLSYAKELNGPVLLHVRTVKGKGYTPAERNPDQFHGVGRFCVETGELVHGSGESFSAVFGETLCSLAEQDGKLCAITAAMQGGTGLNRFARQFPARFFDVGIAEGHAVAMAAGMAKQGMRRSLQCTPPSSSAATICCSTTWRFSSSMWCWRWTGPGWWGRTARPTRRL